MQRSVRSRKTILSDLGILGFLIGIFARYVLCV